MRIESRWMMVGVGVSLLLNVFLVGIIVGHAFGRRGGPFGGRANTGGALLAAEHVRALPENERKLFTSAMSPHREAIRVAHQEQERLRQVVETDIAAPSFDRDKVAADFKALRAGASTIQEATQNGLLDALSQLSQVSRAALVAHDVQPH